MLQPRLILPYALLTFERQKFLNDIISIPKNELIIDQEDIFDIDNSLKQNNLILSSEEVNNDNLSKSRAYYEHTGRLKIKFRGTSKLKIKLTDILKSNMKFLDEDKTCISLKNSTNRLLLTYMDKRTVKATIPIAPTTTVPIKISSNQKVSTSNGSTKNIITGLEKADSLINKKQAEIVNKSLVVNNPKTILNSDHHKPNKKIFSQNVQQSINSSKKQEANKISLQALTSLDTSLNITNNSTTTSPVITSLNSSSTSLEMHLMKSRKQLAATISTTNSVKLNQITKSTSNNPITQQQQQQHQNKVLLNRLSLLERNRKEEQERQKQIKSFWNDNEWKRYLEEALPNYFKQHYEQVKIALELDMRRFNYIIESIKHKILNRKEDVKFDIVNMEKIEAYDPKRIFSGGFNGIEAGKCVTHLRFELQQALNNHNNTTDALILNAVRKIQQDGYALKPKTICSDESLVSTPKTTVNSITATSNLSFNNNINSTNTICSSQSNPDTISAIIDTSLSSSSSSQYTSIVKEKPRLPLVVDEMKKNLNSSRKLLKEEDKMSISSQSDNESRSDNNSLKRKHKSRKMLSKSNKRANTSTKQRCNTQSPNNIVHNNDKTSKKRKKVKKHKHNNSKRKSRSSSISSSYSSISFSSSSSSTTDISYSSSSLSSNSKHTKLKPIYNNTPDSDTRISFNSTRTHSNNDIVNNNGSKIVTPDTLNFSSSSNNLFNHKDDYYDSFYNEYDLSIQSLVGSSSEPNLSKKKIESPIDPPKVVLSAANPITPQKVDKINTISQSPILQQTPVTQTIRQKVQANSVPKNMPIRHSINDKNIRYSQIKSLNTSLNTQLPIQPNNIKPARFRSINNNHQNYSAPYPYNNFQAKPNPANTSTEYMTSVFNNEGNFDFILLNCSQTLSIF